MKSAQLEVHPLACTGDCAVKAPGLSVLIGVLGRLIGLVSLQAVSAWKVFRHSRQA
jgi:hypothetical protein